MPFLEITGEDNLDVRKAFRIPVHEVLRRTVETATCPESTKFITTSNAQGQWKSIPMDRTSRATTDTFSHPSLEGGILIRIKK